MTERDIRLHFVGERTEGHTLPARTLVRSLEQIQRVIFLLAKQERGEDLGRRARVSQEIEREYALICKMPEEGGYVIPAEIGDPSYSFFSIDTALRVAERFQAVSESINENNFDKFRELIPDSTYRKFIQKAFKDTIPPKHSGLELIIERSDASPLLDSGRTNAFIQNVEAAEAAQEIDEIKGFVTGTLVKMDFENRSLALKLLNARTLTAVYSDDYEPVLLDHARDLVQIRGTIRYSEDGNIASITEVVDVLEVDDTDFAIKKFSVDNHHFLLDPPVKFDVDFNRDDAVYEVSSEFDIFFVAETRSALEDIAYEHIEMLWREYALEDDSRLSEKAMALKEALLFRVTELDGDA